MNESNIRELDLDKFIKRMLKDDLPPEAAARMSRHFFHLKRILGRPGQAKSDHLHIRIN